MNLIIARLTDYYLVFFGLYHLPHIFSLIGIYESIIHAPPQLSIWEWHLVLMLVYGVIPIVAALTKNKYLYVFIAVFSFIGVFIELWHVFSWTFDFYIILAFLDLLATAVCMINIYYPSNNYNLGTLHERIIASDQ